jgi:hypothetical protein
MMASLKNSVALRAHLFESVIRTFRRNVKQFADIINAFYSPMIHCEARGQAGCTG